MTDAEEESLDFCNSYPEIYLQLVDHSYPEIYLHVVDDPCYYPGIYLHVGVDDPCYHEDTSLFPHIEDGGGEMAGVVEVVVVDVVVVVDSIVCQVKVNGCSFPLALSD